MPCDTLIHLVSDQTMQNILPILALKPAKVVQVISDASNCRFATPAERIKETVALASQKTPDFRWDVDWLPDVDLRSAAPTIAVTQNAVADLLDKHPSAVVNYTGGTKNMSIGAWLAASGGGIPTLYCDTPRDFVEGGTCVFTVPVTLGEVANKLTVQILLASQGLRQGKEWERRGISPPQQRLGEVSYRLTQEHGQKFREFRHTLLLHGLPKAGGNAKAEDVERVNNEPIPLPGHRDFDPFLDAALEAKLLCNADGKLFYNTSLDERNALKRKSQVERIAQGLTGTAFEAYVAMLLKGSRKFASFLSNIYPAGQHPEEHGFGETDFLAYEPASLALTLISCKSSPPGLEHLESLLARKAKFGGLFALTLLCVEYGVTEDREKNLRSQCQSLGIACAIGDEITSALGA